MALEDLAMFILTAWLPCFRGGRAQPDGARGPGHVHTNCLIAVFQGRTGPARWRSRTWPCSARCRARRCSTRATRSRRSTRCSWRPTPPGSAWSASAAPTPPSSTTTPSGSLSGNWRWVITPVIYDNTERFAVGKLKVSRYPRHLRQHRAVRCRETEGESLPPSSTTTPSGSLSGNWRWVVTPVIYDNTERFVYLY